MLFYFKFRPNRLKERLLRDVPDIAVKSSAYKQGSQLLFFKGLDVSVVISHDNTFNQQDQNDGEDDVEDTDSDLDISDCLGITNESRSRTLYHVGRQVNQDISNIRTKLSWPPKLDELTLTQCMRFVPSSLYNLIALVIGATDDVPDEHAAMKLNDEKAHRKVLSLCQDIVSVGSKGRVVTPKSLACGMTLRHYSANWSTSALVSGLGHAVGYHSLLRLETAAALQTQTREIPTGFTPGAWTTLVWDNIDFAEETLTGADTTHFVNGIMLQLSITEGNSSSQSAEVSRSVRKMPVQEKGIIPIHHTTSARIGPSLLGEMASDQAARLISPALTDLAYLLAKEAHHNPATLPGWKHFNQRLHSNHPRNKTAIHYLPLIEAPAGHIDTVNTIIVRSLALADKLNLSKIVLVFDQAIYAKIQELRWLHPNYAERTIVRMGEFHTIMSYLSILGKRFEGGGLGDLMIESGIVAAGSLPSVMSGKHYNRAARAHKLVFEALSRLRIRQFMEELDEVTANSFLKEADILSTTYMDVDFLSTNQPQLERFNQLYQQHIKSECESSPTYRYWSSYLDMVQLLLTFIRATRESDWDLHLATIQHMLPWFFSYNRTNYSR